MRRVHLGEVRNNFGNAWNLKLNFLWPFFCSLKWIFFKFRTHFIKNNYIQASNSIMVCLILPSYIYLLRCLSMKITYYCLKLLCSLLFVNDFSFYLPQMLRMGFRKFVKKMNLHTNTITCICDSFLGNWLQLVVLETCHYNSS